MTRLHALKGHDSTSSAASFPGRNGVNGSLTPKRARRLVENDDYAAFARRILRAYARRVADGDVEALIAMTGLAEEIDAAIGQAVTGLAQDIDAAIGQAVIGLRAVGYSWAEIGDRLGITRQAAQQRWGRAS